jgi:hypothetical protein
MTRILRQTLTLSTEIRTGKMGWSAQYFTLIVIEGTNEAGILLYSPTAGLGNLVGSWAVTGFTDQYGNVVPAGIFVNQGILNSVTLNGATITASTIANTLISASTIIAPTLSAGTIYETQITFDTGGGEVLGYTTSTTTVTQTGNGTYNFTAVTASAKVECWAAGAGAGGGNNTANGGCGGGAGEYAQEPTYPMVIGNNYAYTIGNGGNGGTTNGNGSGGGDTSFDNGGVFANGGDAGSSHSSGGVGGTGSTNTIHNNGGNGGTTTSSGGASGGNSGNATAAGNNGVNSTTSSGAAAPAAQTGSGRGGAGANTLTNGNVGGSPGGGGGGCGMSSGSGGAFSQTFDCTESRSYYGADATNGNPNGTRASNSTCWQGGETATGGGANGTQKCLYLFNKTAIVAACVGVTVTEVDFICTNAHSWYGSGITVQLKEWLTSQGTSAPASWNGLGSPVLTQYTQAEGSRKTVQLLTNTSAPADFADGTATGIAMGPGPSAYDLSYYGYFDATGSGSNAVQLTIIGTKGSGFETAGAGQDGQVKITYTSSTTIVFALSPVAGTDAAGNAWGVGYTGPTQNFQPGASPAVAEVWHDVGTIGSTFGTGFSEVGNAGEPLQFMLDSNGNVHINGAVNCASGTAEGGKTVFTLPSAYAPNRACYIGFWTFPYTAANIAGDTYATINTSGVVSLGFPAATTITAIIFNGDFPLNSNAS